MDGSGFYLGTHKVDWLGRADFPLFVSNNQLRGRKKLPVARGPWYLDSGGFSQVAQHGCWLLSPEDYVEDVKRYQEFIGNLGWAAIQDWMCEPFILEKSGRTIEEHQLLTIQSWELLNDLYDGVQWLPVLQGWTLYDYWRHQDMYAARGHNLLNQPIVGVGSVCRRQGTFQANTILETLAAGGLRLHGFGLKIKGLEMSRGALTSADSMAWSFGARKSNVRMEGCSHLNCANCIRYASVWRDRIIELLMPRWQSVSLFE